MGFEGVRLVPRAGARVEAPRIEGWPKVGWEGPRLDDMVGGGGSDEDPRMEGLPNVEEVWRNTELVEVCPKAEGVAVVVVVPNVDLGCPNASVDVVFPNAEGVEPNPEGVFDTPESLDPNVKADAGIEPNGDDPKDDLWTPEAVEPPPKAD